MSSEESKRDWRSLKKAGKVLEQITQEQTDALVEKYGTETPPHEISKRIAREMLASEMREKMLANGIASASELQMAINDETIVEILEQLVEGDVVIDDAATHQWFRGKLAAYHDFQIQVDEDAEKLAALGTYIEMVKSLPNFDVVFEGGRPDGVVAVIANETGRAAFRGVFGEWNDAKALPDEWKIVAIETGHGKPATLESTRELATKLAECLEGARTGCVVGPYGKIEAVA
jgi:hypothetical protein